MVIDVRQVANMLKCVHPNLVRAYQLITTEDFNFIEMEFCNRGDCGQLPRPPRGQAVPYRTGVPPHMYKSF